MHLNRRQFLTGCSSFLAGLGILDGLFPILNAPQSQALGQTSPKKLALLVGLNQYHKRTRFPQLLGCESDVMLMRNLLVYRFGFDPQDIHVLINEAATRKAIELTFQTHLIDQAKGSDVVVFHFSGFGQYLLPQSHMDMPSQKPLAQYGLLPYDALLPMEQGEASLNPILQETLYLLIQSLKTDRVVTVLDTGFHYPGMSNLDHSRVRSLPPKLLDSVNPDEITVQDELLTHSKLKRSQLTEQRLSTPPRGIVVTAASLQQFGIESDWQGFSAGALTYSLAQQLWHTAPNSSMAAQVSRSAEFLAQEFSLTQQPELVGQKKSTLTRDVLGLPSGVSGDGVITQTDRQGKSGDVWLGGLSPALVKTDKTRTILAVLPHQPVGGNETLVKVNGRKGLWGSVLVLGSGVIATEDVLQERYRLIGKNQPLRLALSSKLEKIEKIDATSVFGSNNSAVKVVNEEQSADIVLSKLERTSKIDQSSESAPEPDAPESTETQTHYCLCSLAGDILPGTVSERPEAVKNRYDAFQKTFDVLRWHQCLEQLINASNSDLSVSAALGTPSHDSDTKAILLAKSTMVTAKGPNTVPADAAPGRILTVNPEAKFQMTLTNSSAESLFVYIFGFDAQPNAIMVYRAAPPTEDSSEKPIFQPFTIEPGSELVLPAEEEEFGIYGPSGIGSLYVLLTRSQLPLTERAIDSATKNANKGSQPKQIKIAEPHELRNTLLTDLAQISQSEPQVEALTDNKYWTLSVKAWAMLRFVYQIL